jgi:hypothetical protein
VRRFPEVESLLNRIGCSRNHQKEVAFSSHGATEGEVPVSLKHLRNPNGFIQFDCRLMVNLFQTSWFLLIIRFLIEQGSPAWNSAFKISFRGVDDFGLRKHDATSASSSLHDVRVKQRRRICFRIGTMTTRDKMQTSTSAGHVLLHSTLS